MKKLVFLVSLLLSSCSAEENTIKLGDLAGLWLITQGTIEWYDIPTTTKKNEITLTNDSGYVIAISQNDSSIRILGCLGNIINNTFECNNEYWEASEAGPYRQESEGTFIFNDKNLEFNYTQKVQFYQSTTLFLAHFVNIQAIQLDDVNCKMRNNCK